MIKENDFVKYTGDYTTLDPIRRNEDFAQVISFLQDENYSMVTLHLVTLNQKLMCSTNLIRTIDTEEKHILRLGFKEVNFSDGKRYFERDGVIISSVIIQFPSIRYFFVSGLCIGDLRNLSQEEIESYLTEGEFDPKKFFSVYPSVHNLNRLFDEIKSKKWGFDIKSICS